ncbi:lipopolysaccharide biosynthesis protein, partial [Mesorhizobium sp. M8A.F.Ca.ET.023.02.2.1]
HKPNAPAEYAKPFLSISQHQRYRYIVSLEGNDVATNLKWIMNSKSLCLMPPPTYETWFAERQLEANVHYVPLEADFSNLADHVAYFERNPAKAERIIAAANAYCRTFDDERTEQAISLLVLYKYFVLSGQIKPDAEVWRYITG